jgi:hypothetical protein
VALITLRYDIDLGLQKAENFLADVAAIQLEKGELDLLGMAQVGDMVEVTSLTTLTRIVTLQSLPLADQSFPTAQDMASATEKLYRAQLELALPARVTAVAPYVEMFTPLNVESAELAFWWRGDIGVVFDSSDFISQWSSVILGSVLAPTAPGTEPTHVLSDANLNGQQSVNYDGSDSLDSALAASAWNFLHDGTGMTVIVATRPTSNDPAQVLLSTATIATNNRGMNLYYDGGARTWFFQVGNGAALAIDIGGAAGSGPLSTMNYTFARFLEGRPGNEWSLRINAAVAQGNTAAAPNAGDAQATLRVGASAVSGADPVLGMAAPEYIFYRGYVSDEEIEELFLSYLTVRYG